jgi:hypothetical protein
MGTTTETYDVTASLQGRARRLRRQAASSTPPLAEAYRRRAAELDLQAWLDAVWNPPLDLRVIVDPRRPVAAQGHSVCQGSRW